MHDTAYKIGGLVLQTYCPPEKARILEIGSYAVNGALRDHAPCGTDYVGLDIEAGPGVDVVSAPGEPFPVDNDSFDLVLASSVFEHDAAFWLTFLEMCRKAKPDGYVYVSAPSNGAIHRYPQDNWRFYPDAGLALAKWAISRDLDVHLVESFVAGREGDIWNDFVAVFRKGPARPDTTDFVHSRIACENVITWQSDEIGHRRDETEDMVLIATERANTVRLEAERVEREERFTQAMAEKTVEIGDLRARMVAIDEEIVRLNESERLFGDLSAEHETLKHRLADIDSTLRQREEEIAQTTAELAAERSAKAALQAEIAQLLADAERQAQTLADERAWVFKLAGDRQAAEQGAKAAGAALTAERHARIATEQALERTDAKLQVATDALRTVKEELRKKPADPPPALLADLESARREQGALRGELAERFREIAIVSQMLRGEETRAEATADQVEWLRTLIRLRMTGRWWWAFMPPSWRRRRELGRLERRGLFDGAAYLARYPDVAQAGMDPLRHYIFHGMAEGRSPSR